MQNLYLTTVLEHHQFNETRSWEQAGNLTLSCEAEFILKRANICYKLQ